MTRGDDDSVGERLAKADRAIRRAKLEEEIRELGGLIGRPAGESDDASGMERTFLERVIAWETGPFSTHGAWLARREWARDFPGTLPPPRKRAPYRRDHRLPVRD